MLPLDEANAVVETNEKLLRNIIATVLEIIVVSWSSIVARNQICTSTFEVDIAGFLVKEMIAEKSRRFGRYSQFRIEEEVGTRSGAGIPKPDGRIDIKIVIALKVKFSTHATHPLPTTNSPVSASLPTTTGTLELTLICTQKAGSSYNPASITSCAACH